MHPTKVFLAMICPVELLVADETLKRLFIAVDRLVARVEVSPVRGVRTVRAGVALLGAAGPRRPVRRRRGLVFALDAVLQGDEVLDDLGEHGVLAPLGLVRLLVVLAHQVDAHAARPRGRVVAARALEHAQVGVRAEPVLRDARQEAHAAAVQTPEQLQQSAKTTSVMFYI